MFSNTRRINSGYDEYLHKIGRFLSWMYREVSDSVQQVPGQTWRLRKKIVYTLSHIMEFLF